MNTERRVGASFEKEGRVEDNDEEKVELRMDDGRGFKQRPTVDAYLLHITYRIHSRYGMYCNPNLKFTKGLGGCLVFSHS